MIRVLVVDDHPVVRAGVVAILDDEPDFTIIGDCDSAEDALAMVALGRPDVVVMDVRLPGISGIDACSAITERHPSTRVVILTSFPYDGTMVSALACGASGFVLKQADPTTIRTAVRTVAGGGVYADPTLEQKVAALRRQGRRAKGPFGLTLQEMKILERLPRGMSNRDIGSDIGVSESTVKTHLYNAMQKLHAKDRAEEAEIALKDGLA